MLHRGKNFRELDPRPLLTEAAIEMFLENSCTLYDKKCPKLKMSKLSITGILKKLDNLNKSNPLRYMINGIKNEKTKFFRILTPWFGSLAMGYKKHNCNNFY